MSKRIIILVMVCLLIFISCSPKSTVLVEKSGAVIVSIDMKTSKILDTTIHSVTQFSEQENQENTSIFNVEQIKTAIENQGLKVLSIKTNSTAGLFTKFKIMEKDTKDENSFVKTDMQKGSLFLRIEQENINEFSRMLSENDREYLELLMAPAFTGEDLSSEEYEDLIKSAYGENLQKELTKAKFSIEVTCPNKVKSVEIKPSGTGIKKGNKAFIDIPLSEILCLKEPIFAEVKFIP